MSSLELLDDPIAQLREWHDEARNAIPAAHIAALATASANAVPSVRMIDFKGWCGDALTFYTNYESRKGRDLGENPRASLLFYWAPFKRQVQVEGSCRRMNWIDSQAYFATREREVQLSTLMSQQSQELASFELMERRIVELRHELADREIACPAYWGGFLLEPNRIEFRIGREHRRHHRWEFMRTAHGWSRRMLYP